MRHGAVRRRGVLCDLVPGLSRQYFAGTNLTLPYLTGGGLLLVTRGSETSGISKASGTGSGTREEDNGAEWQPKWGAGGQPDEDQSCVPPQSTTTTQQNIVFLHIYNTEVNEVTDSCGATLGQPMSWTRCRRGFRAAEQPVPSPSEGYGTTANADNASSKSSCHQLLLVIAPPVAHRPPR